MKAWFLILFGMVCVLTGCERIKLTPDININFQDPTNVTETSFGLGWSINPSDYQELSIFLARDPDFTKMVATRTFQGNQVNSTKFENLQGAAVYYYRISLVRSPGNIYVSKTKSIELPYQQEFVSFNTEDNATLKGSVYFRGAMEGRRPAVVMMHEFRIFVNGWINSDILKMLVSEGYVCLVYYNRGHGQSSSIENVQDLIDDPSFLANDLRGALSFIQKNELVMADSIALMGASMGASMAVSGNGNEAVLTSVALSPSTMHTTYMYPGIPIKSILYVVGEKDVVDTGDGIIDFPAETAALYKLTEDPKKLMIIENSNAHGTDLLEATGLNATILQWITQHMPVK